MKQFSCTLATLLFLSTLARADNWPGWRGPTSNGQSAEKNLPTTWSEKENVKWKIALPHEGNSSPVVWGSRIFLSQPLDAKGKKRSLWCLDRKDGAVRWQRDVSYADSEPTHGTNPFCSATPVTDGERVIVSHGSAGLYCYDMDGKEQWRYDLGKLYHVWGNASSPILYQNLVILWAGPGERQFLIALDKKTGKKVWQHDEPGGADGIKNKDWIGSWSTPIIARVKDRDELILSCPLKLQGFDPKTGKELWHCDGLGKLVYTSPTIAEDGTVVAFSGYHGPALAVKAGGNGDVTKSRLWHHTKGNPQRIGSAVILGQHCYLVSADGIAHCFDIKTGKDLWEKQNLNFQTWSTLLHADGKLYINSMDSAETVVLAASPTFKELGRNRLSAGEKMRSTPAFADGEIYIRTYRHLWCIGKK
jgi:outer membrane protein assembly factor BamB